MAASEALLGNLKELIQSNNATKQCDDRFSEATTLLDDDQSGKLTKENKSFFDFKRDCNLDDPNMWAQVVGIVKAARSMNGGEDNEALNKEAWEKFRKTVNPSREYTFYGLIINEIRDSLAGRLEKKRAVMKRV